MECSYDNCPFTHWSSDHEAPYGGGFESVRREEWKFKAKTCPCRIVTTFPLSGTKVGCSIIVEQKAQEP